MERFVSDLWGLASNGGWFLVAANVRNIELQTVEPSVGLSRNWRRKTGRPLHKYTRVTLPHQYRSAEVGEGDGSARPLELVKGHFKTYDATRPLFGKLTGTWWWTSTIRGDPKAGTREHDYAFGPEAPERPDAE